MIKIDNIESKIILDSLGNETIEVTLFSDKESTKASVPAGKSRGVLEAVPVRASEAGKNIDNLLPKITKKNFKSLSDFDKFLIEIDGAKDKRNLGANTILALSMAFTRLWAKKENLPLYKALSVLADVKDQKFPKLFFNLINGGLHVRPEWHPLPFQEYLVIPDEPSPRLGLKLIFEFIEALKMVLYRHKLVDPVAKAFRQGDEGGFAVSGANPFLGFDFLEEARDSVDFGNKLRFGSDAAASSFWNPDKKKYVWDSEEWSSDELIEDYEKMIIDYPILSFEDPLYEENWDEWRGLNEKIGDKVWLVGDDLTVTNVERFKLAYKNQAVNAVIVKPNQIGSVSETLEAVKLAKKFDWKIIVSHRSGETMDDFIADLAYGVGADGLKSGAPLQKERLAKYDRLIEIEKELQ